MKEALLNDLKNDLKNAKNAKDNKECILELRNLINYIKLTIKLLNK